MANNDLDIRRVGDEVRRFKKHLLAYMAVVVVVFISNDVTGGFWYGHLWLFVILLAWAILVALQGARLFSKDVGREWEDRMAERIVTRRRREASPAQASAAGKSGPPPSPPSSAPPSPTAAQ